MTTTAPTWTWAVTVTVPGGQTVPAIALTAFSDQAHARESAADFVETHAERTPFEADARRIAKSMLQSTSPDSAPTAQSLYSGIYSAHILPVAPGQSPQQAWEQHTPPAFAGRLAMAWTWAVAQTGADTARVIFHGGPFPADRQQAEKSMIGALSILPHPDATRLKLRWAGGETDGSDSLTNGRYMAALVPVPDGLGANAEDAVHDALTARFASVTYRHPADGDPQP
ncbi:hypothetical protein AB0N09_05230 [Streptomyces erythrochromogenes]|uniref:hypothetical protein n=1 Tax=Streptomyces erythrochromogenes TaxID=285574 RepID=UPI003449BBC8